MGTAFGLLGVFESLWYLQVIILFHSLSTVPVLTGWIYSIMDNEKDRLFYISLFYLLIGNIKIIY
jgi:ABC-type tungstate transport system substrate-binding protein